MLSCGGGTPGYALSKKVKHAKEDSILALVGWCGEVFEAIDVSREHLLCCRVVWLGFVVGWWGWVLCCRVLHAFCCRVVSLGFVVGRRRAAR